MTNTSGLRRVHRVHLLTIWALFAALSLSACGGGGDTPPTSSIGGGAGASSAPPTPTSSPPPASGLQYPTDWAWFEVGAAVGPWQPTVTGGTASQYTVTPALPAGLLLDPSTGVLSGAVRTAAPQSTYTISANVGGTSVQFNLTLWVEVPPSGLSYASPVQASVGTAFSMPPPVVSGNVDHYLIWPALPAGLQIDGAGVLSGTPRSARPPAIYTITASDRGGSGTTFDLTLAVGPPAPGVAVTGTFRDLTVIGLGYQSGTHSGLTDGHGQFTYEGGQSITFNVGGVSLGTVSVPKTLITPVDLMANGTGASNYVLNVVRFLMMLDQDRDASNGIQISAAVTTVAAGWAPVDFDTSDLPSALSAIIQQASTADNVTHTLPDTAAAQARLRAEFYCTYSGHYAGMATGNSTPGDHGFMEVDVLPDGSVHSVGSSSATATLPEFDLTTANALNPLLDASFALSSQSQSITLQGTFSDPTYLSGTFLADAAGTFEAVSDTGTDATFKLVGTYTILPNDPTGTGYTAMLILAMDDSYHVSGFINGYSLRGSVTGTTFVGTVTVPVPCNRGEHCAAATIPVSGTFSNTSQGYTLNGQFGAGPGSAGYKFSTSGCRVN
jgi:hypothetical protein